MTSFRKKIVVSRYYYYIFALMLFTTHSCWWKYVSGKMFIRTNNITKSKNLVNNGFSRKLIRENFHPLLKDDYVVIFEISGTSVCRNETGFQTYGFSIITCAKYYLKVKPRVLLVLYVSRSFVYVHC